MKAVSVNQTENVVHPSEKDLPSNEQTVFILKNLSLSEQSVLKDQNRMVDGEFVLASGATELLALHLGLVGVQNLEDEDGNEVVFERDEKMAYIRGVSKNTRPWKESCLERIPQDVRLWLSMKIRGLLDEEEETEKN